MDPGPSLPPKRVEETACPEPEPKLSESPAEKVPEPVLPLKRIEEANCPELKVEDPKAPRDLPKVVLDIKARLRVALATSDALVDIVELFISKGLVKGERPEAVYFVRAAYLYAHSLMFGFFNFDKATSKIRRDAQETRGLQHLLVLVRKLKKEIQKIEITLGQLEEAFKKVEATLETLEEAIKKDGWSLDLTSLASPALVPTASPYQLFLEAFLTSEDIMTTLREFKGDDAALIRIMSELLRKLLVRQADTTPSKVEKKNEKKKDANGQPQIVALSVHHDYNGDKSIVVGCNAPDLEGFPEGVTFVKGLRESRMAGYLPRGKHAFECQWKLEELRLKNNGWEKEEEGSAEFKRLLMEARMGAIKDMRTDESFLGGEDKVCMAFKTSTWERKLACVVCSGTLGFQDPDASNPNALIGVWNFFLKFA